MKDIWKALLVIIIILGLLYLSSKIIRGSGQYEWIMNEEKVGIYRTDTNKVVFIPDFNAPVQPGTNILKSDLSTGIKVTFYDQTVLPGRVTLAYNGITIDVMESGVTVNSEKLMWVDRKFY